MEFSLHFTTLLIHFCTVCLYLFYRSLSVQSSIPVHVIFLSHGRVFILKIFYNSLYGSPIFSISSSSSHSSILLSSFFSSSFSLLILSFPFHLFQFLSSCPQYSLSNLLSSYLYNIFAIYLPSNSPFLSSDLYEP